LLTVAAFCAVLAPQRAQLSVLPAIELSPAPQAASAPSESASTEVPASDASEPWTALVARAWLMLYLAGVCVAAARLALAQRALRHLVHGAIRLDDLAEQPVAVSVANLLGDDHLSMGSFSDRSRGLRTATATSAYPTIRLAFEHKLGH
jgi:hypothetical protein